MKAKILVIDDDQMIVNAMKRVLSIDGFEVDGVLDGQSGLQAFADKRPDLVILDVTMPGMSGLEVCRKIKSRHAEVAVLMLSARDEVPDRVIGLESGADDYLIKPFAFEELTARIKVLLRRVIDERPEKIIVGDLTLDLATMGAIRGKRPVSLSATEFRLLQFLMSNPGQVLSKDRILERVWGYGFFGDVNIVEVYIRYLRNKLELPGEKKLIHTVRSAGYMLRADD